MRDSLKRLTILLAIAIIAGVTAFASPVQQLDVTPDQKAAVQAIIRQANDQVRRVESANQYATSPRKLQKEFREIRAIRAEALQEIRTRLTADQQTIIEQLLSGTRQNKEDKKQFLQSLDLTRQQKIQIAKILGRAEDHAWQIAGDGSLDFAEIGRQIRQIQKNALQNIHQQLTYDQQVKFDAWQQRNARTTS